MPYSTRYGPLTSMCKLTVCIMADSGILFPLILGVTMQQMYVELASHMDNHDNTSGHSLMH